MLRMEQGELDLCVSRLPTPPLRSINVRFWPLSDRRESTLSRLSSIA